MAAPATISSLNAHGQSPANTPRRLRYLVCFAVYLFDRNNFPPMFLYFIVLMLL